LENLIKKALEIFEPKPKTDKQKDVFWQEVVSKKYDTSEIKRRDEERRKRELARRKLLWFIKYVYPGYQVNWHHELICTKIDELISGNFNRLMIFTPPQHGKSVIVSECLPVYLLGRFPKAKIIAASYGQDLANKMSRKARRFLREPKYNVLFPDTIMSIDRGAVQEWETTEGGIYRCAGVGGGITGYGFNFGIIDDPLKGRLDAESDTIRQKVIDWYESSFITRKQPEAKIIIIQTRWHENDLSGHLLDVARKNLLSDQWEVVDLPAIMDERKPTIGDNRKIGEPLWEGRHSLESLLKVKQSIGSYNWSSIYQQTPQNKGGMMNFDWFKTFNELPPRDEWLGIYQFWDTAQKASEITNAPWVCGTWVRTEQRYYLVDVFRRWLNYPEGKENVLNLYEKYKPVAVVIEDKSTGSSLIQELQRETMLPVLPFLPEGDKITRFFVETPAIESGRVYIKTVADWRTDFDTEIRNFPNSTTKD